MALVFLGLGTNIGSRAENLRAAITGLAPYLNVVAVSRTFETPPWGVLNQPPFLNLCLSGETLLSPRQLLIAIKNLERDLGRKPDRRWGPRLIDIDILFFEDVILMTPGLTVPHPGIAERPFVLAPLADIAPSLKHPVTGWTVNAMLAAVDATSVQPVE